MRPVYGTDLGVFYEGLTEEFIQSSYADSYRGKVDLLFTSPPFPLNRKKKYGNLQGQQYIDWLSGFAQSFRDMLAPDGSIVIEVGNSWELGSPVMSTLALRALLAFLDVGKFQLCQQFVWHNPAKLPSPAQWVNIERIRLKDSFTYLWWMSATDRPKANNRNVLSSYSPDMKRLISTRKYNAGKRPSEHQIGQESFFTDNGGAIPSNVLTVANTESSSPYLAYCKANELPFHPARMPLEIAEFFIKLLTDPNDLVFDPFAGSNTTGASAEFLDRQWISVEPNIDYISGSRGRFEKTIEFETQV